MKILLVLLCAACLNAQEPFSGAAAVDQQMERAVKDGLIPGGVVLIGHNGQVVYQKAYGSRALIPHREAMTLDTIFDAASLTKVIATTPAIMRLFEQGQIRLNDPVTKYLPEFQGGHSDITIRNLMTHFSGLRPDLDLKPAWSGYETGIQRALIDKPAGPPGVRFVYSDINFILLGEIVHRLTGKMLNEYRARKLLPAAGHARNDVFAAGLAAPAHCSHRNQSGHRPALARRGARRYGALHGRRRGPRGRVHHRRRSREVRANDAGLSRPKARATRRSSAPRPFRSSLHRNLRPTSRFCAAWAGTSIHLIRAIAANCFRSVLTATPDSPALRCGSTRSAARTSSF